MVKIGDFVTYVDTVGVEHAALLTNVFAWVDGPPDYKPCVNVLYVSDDENKTDQYGRQIIRESSVTHQSGTPAHGRFWK